MSKIKRSWNAIAFNWDDEEFTLLSAEGDIDRMLVCFPNGKRHSFARNIPEETKAGPRTTTTSGCMVSVQGRIGARLSDRFTYTCYVQEEDAGFKAHAHRDNLALPVRNGLVYWSRDELIRYSVSYVQPFDPRPTNTEVAKHRAVDCSDVAKYSLDRAERYLWVTNETGTGTLYLRFGLLRDPRCACWLPSKSERTNCIGILPRNAGCITTIPILAK